MNYHRPQLTVLLQRMQERRRFIQVLIGPRQVGKSTMIGQLLKKVKLPHYAVSADGVSVNDQTWLQQQWEIARLRSRQSPDKGFIFVVDEIQKLHQWSELVKRMWDADTQAKRNIKIILLGSSRLLIQQGLTESLAGRFETTYMPHWSFIEMKKAFGWNEDQFIWFGGYPGSASLVKNETRWKEYVNNALIETSLSKDILMLTRVDKPALMRKLFELGCLYSGQVLSFNKILGQLLDAGNTTTLSHYLELLHTAGLLGGLEKYSPNVIRQRASSPKFMVHNTALISAQSPLIFKEIRKQPDAWGRIVESAIGAHLMNYSLVEKYQLNYWRENNDEVDFVLIHKNKVIGLEVKSSVLRNKKGMDAFKNKMNPDKIFLIGEGGIPHKEFLSINPAELFT